MKKFFLLTMLVTLFFSSSICAAKDIWMGKWSPEGGEYYVMDETIRNTTPPSAHEYWNFDVSIKIVYDGEIDDILTYRYSKIRNDAWGCRLVKREYKEMSPAVDTYLVQPGDKIFQFAIKRLGWSYELIDGRYY